MIKAYNTVIEFFKESYRLSKVAFYCELAEAIMLIGASAVLTFTVLAPATKIFIPMYLVGSVLGVISTSIRKAGFAMVLTLWFVVMNSIAMVQLFLM
jgi:hypothetical protein|tara:strand:+ start:7613 stop:7903 length:291 start_codon:yes stop_codon:yes gene_type:complete